MIVHIGRPAGSKPDVGYRTCPSMRVRGQITKGRRLGIVPGNAGEVT